MLKNQEINYLYSREEVFQGWVKYIFKRLKWEILLLHQLLQQLVDTREPVKMQNIMYIHNSTIGR